MLVCVCVCVCTLVINLALILTDTKLTQEDTSTIYDKLFNARTKWFNIGLTLKVDNETLQSIRIRHREDPDKCLLEMIAYTLKACSLTWRDLCDCLRSPTVAHNELAEEIESDLKGVF